MKLALQRREMLGGMVGTLLASPLLSSCLADAQGLLIPATAPFEVVAKSAVGVSINVVAGTLVNVEYTTPNGNDPARFANMLYVWSVSDDTVPWNRTPETRSPVIGNAPQGDQNITNVSITDGAYLVGYAVGPAEGSPPSWSPYRAVVASAFIPPVTGDSSTAAYTDAAADLDLRFVGSTSLAYGFSFLSGFRAASSGAWAGLWQGAAASYTIPPVWAAAIQEDTNTGVAGLNGIRIVRNGTYTLGLFAEGYDPSSSKLDLTRLAATLTFFMP